MDDPRTFLITLFNVAVAAADPVAGIRAHLPARPKGRTIVVGAGKAASQMAQAFEHLWDGPLEGVVVARHGPVAVCHRIRVLQAAHPVPDAAGLVGALALMDAVANLSSDDLVVALISGGGSALLPAPASGLTLADEVAVNQALLASGAPISAMNTIRKHISRIKGGRLALAAYPAKVVSLIVSDVPGDNPAFVASGPTVPDGTNLQDAVALIDRYGLSLPARVIAHLARPEAAAPNPDDARFQSNRHHIIASARLSLIAAARAAESAGVAATIVSDAIEGEARLVGQDHASLARNYTGPRPAVILSGGETTVTLAGSKPGQGGRNSEFLLGFALGIEGLAGITALAADTDGIDGSTDNAGAFADGNSIARMRTAGIDPAELLVNHDSYHAFAVTNDLFVTGPTGTNVNDFRAILLT